ncbi:diguanylate cyclase [Breoghania sp.]|uniref:sensor domain-containing diguanylate cyclase n=1 Tax=Breoghania sp. TaxID=2065378 RepID=UPI002AA8F7E9|nr:diguanylate cyclase [Breoghania sp.]
MAQDPIITLCQTYLDAAATVSEEARLGHLDACDVLDTGREDEFDRLVRMVRSAFNAPIALLSFISDDRIFFKSEIGLGSTTIPREGAFCNYTIRQDEPFLVRDTLKDERLADFRLIEEMPRVRAYAGAPLIVAPGVRLGAIAICDTKPRDFTETEVQTLVDLSRVAVDEIRLRRSTHEAEVARKQLSAAIEAIPGGFMLFDEEDRLVLFNRRIRDLYPPNATKFRVGVSYEEIVRETIMLGWYPDAVGDEEARIQGALEYHRDPQGDVEQPTANGGWLRVSDTRTETGETVAFRVDISDLKQRERDLFLLATRDTLTGLLSRGSILDKLNDEIERSERYGARSSILIIDADHFKQVNDRCGHQAGDGVLKEIACRLTATLREVDRIGRLGGEEFIVVLPDTGIAGAVQTAERLRKAIETLRVPARDARHPDGYLRVTVSIGVAEFRAGESSEGIYARADTCLYAAKAAGRNRIEYDCELEEWDEPLQVIV